MSDALGQARRTLGRARRKLHRLRHPEEAPALRAEKAVSRLRRDLVAQLTQLHRDVSRLDGAVATAGARLDKLDARSAAVSSGLDALARRPGPPPPPPRAPAKTLAANVLEDNVVLSGLQADGPRPRVVIVLQGFGVHMLFAGIRTALLTAVELARRLDRPLAMVVLEPLNADPDAVRTEVVQWLTDELDAADVAANLTLSAPEGIRRHGGHPDDIWMATFWTTAFQLGRLCDRGALSPDHVVYLIQDWEPGFYAWGTEHALAGSTYSLRFHLLVNSSSLADYVSERVGRPIPADQVIAPQVDEDRLRSATDEWAPRAPDSPRILFYARPSKPRNLYPLGLAALQQWALTVDPSAHPVVTLAGEDLTAPDLGPGITLEAVGKLDMDEYYALLARTDVGLALMHSPHPSHLALELPMTGIPTITNAVENHRKPWVTGLEVVEATPHALAAALTAHLERARTITTHEFVPLGATLGRPLGECLDALVTRLPAAGVPAGVHGLTSTTKSVR
ncbi:hypothetical protein [uncultured Jatrophihabitans sp.]|uniref:rhamnosyltransferase WsaF family glycosyltransferase n=1 Tax=uncultured Jatrophihabitans sp. TaxID=1610747 RepID=UPI0035C95E45